MIENWVWFYVMAVCFVGHFACLTTPAFNKQNMLRDPLTMTSRYVVTDYKGRTKIVPLKVGVFLSLFTVLSQISVFVLTILSFFYASTWWYALLVVLCSFFLAFLLYVQLFKLSLFSILFYVELIGIPFMIFFTNYYLCF